MSIPNKIIIQRDFISEEKALEAIVAKSGLDLYSFVKNKIMNMNMEHNCNTSMYMDVIRQYALHQGLSYSIMLKNTELVKHVTDSIKLNDERFSIFRHTYYEQETENLYYYDNLKALNLTYNFTDKPKRLKIATGYEIICIIEELKKTYGDLKKKEFYDLFSDLRVNGEDSTFF